MPLFDRRTRRGRNSDMYLNQQSPFIPRMTRPPERNTAEFIEAFKTSPRLAVVDRIATDLSFIPGKLFRIEDDGTETEITDHPFLDFLDYPNPLPEYTNNALWRLQEIYLHLKGEGYFIKERDKWGRVCELWPLPVHYVVSTPYEGFPCYTVRVPGTGLVLQVNVDDMFVQKYLNPYDPSWRGQGLAEAIASEVDLDKYMTEFQRNFFYNDATPGLVAVFGGNGQGGEKQADQRKRFAAEWLNNFRGRSNSHKFATVAGDVRFERLGETGKELDMVESRVRLRDAALEHFGMPREIMGITENSNRATSEAAQYDYAERVLTPKIRLREDAINEQLLPDFDRYGNLVYRFDAIVPRNEEFDKAKALEGWNGGLLTKNEGRELLGFDAVEGGDIYKTTFSDMFIRDTDDPVAVTAAAANLQFADIPVDDEPDDGFEVEIDGKQRPYVIYTKDRQRKTVTPQQMRRSEQQAARKSLRAFETATTRFFKQQADDVRKALDGKKAEGGAYGLLDEYLLPDGTFDVNRWISLPEAQQFELAAKFSDQLIDWNASAFKMEQIYRPLWSQAHSAGAAQMQQLYGLKRVKQPNLSRQAQTQGARRVVGIQDSTKDDIAQVVARRIREGSSTRELADEIMSTMNAPEKRAKLIARQETMTSLSTGQFDMMVAGGATGKTWHHHCTTPDAREKHIALNGKTIGIQAWFQVPGTNVKLRYPRDPLATGGKAAAGQVIRCYCELTYDFEY